MGSLTSARSDSLLHSLHVHAGRETSRAHSEEDVGSVTPPPPFLFTSTLTVWILVTRCRHVVFVPRATGGNGVKGHEQDQLTLFAC